MSISSSEMLFITSLILYFSPFAFSFYFSFSKVEAVQTLPASQQHPTNLPSLRLSNPAWPKPCHQTRTLLQSPEPRLLLQVLHNHNLSRHLPQLKTPLRMPQLHLVPQRPLPQHLFQTGTHRPPHSQPEPQDVRNPDRRQQSGQRAWQSEFKWDFSHQNIFYFANLLFFLTHLSFDIF